MSDIAVTVTNPGSAAVTIGAGGSVSATVSSGGSVAVNLPGGEAAWANITGKPTTFTPAAHTHLAAEITDRATALVTSVNGQTGAVTISGGGGGASLSDATPQALGTASAGTSSSASRADHVHALPALVASLNTLTGPLTLAAGTGVTITPSGSTLTIASTASGVGLSDATPEPLGLAQAGDDAEAARADHVHAVPTISEIDGLQTILDAKLDNGSTVDGGDYVGVIVGNTETPTITITSQPENQTVSLDVGTTWTTGGTGNSGWRAVAYNGTRWVAVGSWFNSPSGYYVTTSTDGATWSVLGNSGTPQFAAYGVATDATTFLAVGGTSCATTSNGTTWTAGGSLSTTAYAVAYGNSRWCAVGTGACTSTDNGATWSSASSLPATVAYLCHGANGFVALGSSSGTSSIYRSIDGVTWSTHSLPASAIWQGVAFGNGTYVAIRSGASCAYSTDGQTWTQATMPSSGTWRGVSYAGGRFFAFRAGSNVAAYSTDGINWTQVTLPASGTYAASAGGVSSIVAISTTSAPHVRSVGSAAATFAVSAVVVPTASLAYQWQLSTDSGSTWANVSGSTAGALSLTGLVLADSGKRYRVQISATGAATVTSNSATLTVT